MDYYLARSMERFPNDAVFQIRKANRQYIKGDLHGAIATFDEALGFAQNDTVRGELWGYIGDAYHAIADRARLKKLKADTVKAYPVRLSEKAAMKRCYEAYDNALALWSDNVLVLNNYAYFLSVQNTDLERALEMSKRATTLEQNNSTYIDTYAWILYMMGRLDEARTQMRQALSLDRSGSAELPLHYGDILYAMGEKFMAETYWRRALEAGADPKRIEQRMAISKSGTKGRVEELGAE
jgi:tetratricopeptide (TPR) repeat protein